MKKKDRPASERVGAMLLGGAICSKDRGKYPGPLFARKKNHYIGKFFVFLFIVGVVFSFWERGRVSAAAFVSKFLNSNSKSERSLASDAASEPIYVETPQEEQKLNKNER